MDNITKGFIEAAKRYPYYSKGFAALTIIKSDKIPTAGVDKYWRIYINESLYQLVRRKKSRGC